MSEPSNTTQIHLYFESFFRDEIRNIVRDVYFVVWNKDDALDIAVDAFTKALVKWNSVSRLDRPGAWVRKVAMRAAIKFKKRRRRETNDFDSEPSYTPDSTRAIVVRDAVMKLSPQQRAATILHYFDDLPVLEVAEIMKCRESTVKRYLFDARQNLARHLGDLRD